MGILVFNSVKFVTRGLNVKLLTNSSGFGNLMTIMSELFINSGYFKLKKRESLRISTKLYEKPSVIISLFGDLTNSIETEF